MDDMLLCIIGAFLLGVLLTLAVGLIVYGRTREITAGGITRGYIPLLPRSVAAACEDYFADGLVIGTEAAGGDISKMDPDSVAASIFDRGRDAGFQEAMDAVGGAVGE